MSSEGPIGGRTITHGPIVAGTITEGDSGYGSFGAMGEAVDPLGRLPPRWALIGAFVACVPIGLWLIVLAGRARRSLHEGDGLGAAQAAEIARWWTWVGFAAGVTTQSIVLSNWLLRGG